MTQLKTATAAPTALANAPNGSPAKERAEAFRVLVIGGVLLGLLSVVHLPQGASATSLWNLLTALFSSDDGASAARLRARALDSRLPRLAVGLVVGPLGFVGWCAPAIFRLLASERPPSPSRSPWTATASGSPPLGVPLR